MHALRNTFAATALNNNPLTSMNVADISRAPSEYLEVSWISDLCKLGCAVGWSISFGGMIYKGLRDKTYGVPLLSICCNFGWEVTHAIIRPLGGFGGFGGTALDRSGLYAALSLDTGIIYTAIRYGPDEWARAPLVRNNIPLIMAVSVVWFITANLALCMQIGPGLAQAVGAYACQLLWNAGLICQLISRGHSRGTSYIIWVGHFFGSLVLVPEDYLRYKYRRKDHEFMGEPLYLWFVGMWFVLEIAYPITLWYVRRFERQSKLKTT